MRRERQSTSVIIIEPACQHSITKKEMATCRCYSVPAYGN